MAALNGKSIEDGKLNTLSNETVLLLSKLEPKRAERRALDEDDLIKFQHLKQLIYQGDAEQLLLKLVEYQNFSIDTQDNTDRFYSLLHHAAEKREADCLRALLELEANPNIQAENGRAAIHLLVSSDCRCEPCTGAIMECLQILCDGGAEVDLEDDFGETSLYYAARNRLDKPAELLLTNGANINHWVDGTSVATILARYVPDVLKTEFDKCILIEDNGSPTGLRLDFRLLLQEVAVHEGFARKLSSPRKEIFPTGWPQDGEGLKNRRRTQNRKNSSSSASTAASSSSPSFVQPKETELLNYLLKADLPAIEAVVNHPLVEAFLHLKWLSVRKLFFFLRSLYLLLMSLYTFYVFDTFVNATCFYPNASGVGESFSNSNMTVMMSTRENSNETKEKVTFGFFNPSGGPRPWQSFSEYFKANEMVCEPPLRTMIIAYLFGAYAIIGVLYEVYKMCESWADYFTTPLNGAWWILAGNMAITALPGVGLYGHSWLYPYAAFSLVYGWILVLAQVGRMPYFGIFVGIFMEVLKDFCLLLLTFSPILIAFALGFSVMLPQNEFFRSILTAIFKVFLMMTGDVDFWGIFRETWAVVSITENNKGFVYIPLFLIYSSFILMVTMVLMSVLLGLAVNDIQEIRREASLKRTVRLIQEIGIFESMLQIPTFFHCGCSEYFMRLFSITSLKCMNGPELITFPDDPEDLTLPLEIKQKLVPYLKSGCCTHYFERNRKKAMRGRFSSGGSSSRIKHKERTSRLELERSSEKVIIPEESNGRDGENKSQRLRNMSRQLSESGDPNVEKSRQMLYRDLSLYHDVKMLLNSNEELRRQLETLKSKLIGKN